MFAGVTLEIKIKQHFCKFIKLWMCLDSLKLGKRMISSSSKTDCHRVFSVKFK